MKKENKTIKTIKKEMREFANECFDLYEMGDEYKHITTLGHVSGILNGFLDEMDKIEEVEAKKKSIKNKKIKLPKKGLLIISGFPGVGKSYYLKKEGNRKHECVDLDSSYYETDFPSSYLNTIKHIYFMGKNDSGIVFVSSHKSVRDGLKKENIDFVVVYPDKKLKEEYLDEFRERGDTEEFISLISKNWDSWIDEIESEKNKKIKLGKDEYISDLLK